MGGAVGFGIFADLYEAFGYGARGGGFFFGCCWGGGLVCWLVDEARWGGVNGWCWSGGGVDRKEGGESGEIGRNWEMV